MISMPGNADTHRKLLMFTSTRKKYANRSRSPASPGCPDRARASSSATRLHSKAPACDRSSAPSENEGQEKLRNQHRGNAAKGRERKAVAHSHSSRSTSTGGPSPASHTVHLAPEGNEMSVENQCKGSGRSRKGNVARRDAGGRAASDRGYFRTISRSWPARRRRARQPGSALAVIARS